MPFTKILNGMYYDVDTGYSSIKKTYEDYKANDSTITLDDVKQWVNKQPNQQIIHHKSYNRWAAPYARFEYQTDIMDMNNLKSDYIYAVIFICDFSKLADAEPMKDKQTNTVYQALLKICQKIVYPSSIYSDDDGSFKGKVQELFNAENMNHITTLTHANIAERFIRTLKNGTSDRIRGNDKKWYDMLKHVINKYSNTVNSTIEMKPVQAHRDDNSLEVKQNIECQTYYTRKYPHISVGDKVKI